MTYYKYILSLIICLIASSCYTVVETVKDNSSDIYISQNNTVIVNETIYYDGSIYIENPVEPALPKSEKTKYIERKKERPTQGTRLRNESGQRSSNNNGNVARGNPKSNVKDKKSR